MQQSYGTAATSRAVAPIAKLANILERIVCDHWFYLCYKIPNTWCRSSTTWCRSSTNKFSSILTQSNNLQGEESTIIITGQSFHQNIAEWLGPRQHLDARRRNSLGASRLAGACRVKDLSRRHNHIRSRNFKSCGIFRDTYYTMIFLCSWCPIDITCAYAVLMSLKALHVVIQLNIHMI